MVKPLVRRPTKEPEIKWIGGICKTNCMQPNCPRGFQPLDRFAPAVSNKTHRKRAAFFDVYNAIMAIDRVLNNPDAVKLVDEMKLLRTKRCLTCRLISKKSAENPDTKYGACRAKWREIKADLERRGCCVCGCNDGMTVEHTKPWEKKRDKKDKPVNLGDYRKWTALGGPAAMQAEYDKESVVPMCFNCQFMQPTHDAMKPKLDPAPLPDGEPSGTPEERAQYHKKWDLTVKREKQAYVNRLKLAIGGCATCWFKVVPHGGEYTPGYTGYPHAFQFAHKSELDKESNISELVRSRATLKTVKRRIDAEVRKCRLLCACCHRTETNGREHAPGVAE